MPETPLMDNERLRELLLDLERARSWERELRQESEALLEGLKALALSEDSQDVFPRLLQVLQGYFQFDKAWVLAQTSENNMQVVACHAGAECHTLLSSIWEIGAFFQRVLKGKPVAVFNVASISEWQAQSAEIKEGAGSALHIPLQGLKQKALLIAVHAQTGFFTPRHVSLAAKLSLLASQALRQHELQRELQLANQELELRVIERTQELQTANQALLKAARLKDEFLATMSHELRTPLTAVLGMTDLIAMEILGPLTPKQAKSLGTIQESGKHLLSLVNNVLDLAKIEAGKLDLNREWVNLQELGTTALSLVRPLAESKNIAIGFVCKPFDLRLSVDMQQMKQALVNLLSNAIKFTPEEGRIDLIMQEDPENGKVSMAVRDTGIGISKENISQLFQPFVQIDRGLDRRYAGTGLGLTLVKQITELHGGIVKVDSNPGQGSTFGLLFPGANPNTIRLHISPEGQSLSETTTPQILIVDDHPANLDLLGEYLESLGYRTLLAESGHAAMSLLEVEKPDLILTDMQMPEMSGIELIQRLRTDARWADLPIVALTSLSMPWEKEAIMNSGASFYLCKPIDLKSLQRVLKSLLDEGLQNAAS